MAIFSATQPSDWFSGLAGPGASLPIVSLLLGAVILFFGRRLFWLCVAAIGFAAGVELAPHLMTEPTPLLQLTIALVLGFIGALLATFLQKIAIAVAGFVAGKTGRRAVGRVRRFNWNRSLLDCFPHWWRHRCNSSPVRLRLGADLSFGCRGCAPDFNSLPACPNRAGHCFRGSCPCRCACAGRGIEAPEPAGSRLGQRGHSTGSVF